MAHTYTYDQFGRLTKRTDGAYTADYYYHYGDKLTKVASNYLGEGTVTYTYGGDQKRRSRAVSGGDTIQYRYDRGWNVVNEEDGSGTLETTYVHSPVRQIGTVLATSEGTTASTGDWAYYFQDAIGSTRGLWDNSGDRLGKYDYTPFGGKYAEHGEDITRKFTGHDWDSETRLYYTAYRYYSPDSNRWLTRDPLGMVDGPNVYAYVVGNPVSMWDALGQFSFGSMMTSIGIGLEVILSMADVWSAFSVVTDPCASASAKLFAIGSTAIGLVSPGGGWGAGGHYVMSIIPPGMEKYVYSTAETFAWGKRTASGSRRISQAKIDELLAAYPVTKARDWTKQKGWDLDGVEYHWYKGPNGLKAGLKVKTPGALDPRDL